VPASKQAAITDLSIRAQGYGFSGVTVDGNDVLAVYSAAKEAVERARNGGGPTFIEAKTYRFVPHTSDDDDSRYRSREEVEEWEKKGPLVRFRSWLEESDVASKSEVEKIEAKAMAEIDAATEYAEAAPTPDPATAMRHVFVEED
jgi:2-oxoisovalerate dehydrogenase E1 component alpha subunit